MFNLTSTLSPVETFSLSPIIGFLLCLSFKALTISLLVAGLGTSLTTLIGLSSSARLR